MNWIVSAIALIPGILAVVVYILDVRKSKDNDDHNRPTNSSSSRDTIQAGTRHKAY